jgi:hypothetical protein
MPYVSRSFGRHVVYEDRNKPPEPLGGLWDLSGENDFLLRHDSCTNRGKIDAAMIATVVRCPTIAAME